MGVTFQPKDAKRIAKVVRKVERTPVNRTMVNGNISRDFKTVAVRNNTVSNLPAGTPIWFEGYYNGAYSGLLIPHAGITSWGILAGGCASGELGSAYVEGFALVRIEGGLELLHQDRLQLLPRKTYVGRGHGQYGPLLFMEQDTGTGLGVVLIQRFNSQGL